MFTSVQIVVIVLPWMTVIDGYPQQCTNPPDLEKRFLEANYGVDYRSSLILGSHKLPATDIEFQAIVSEWKRLKPTQCPVTYLKGDFPLMLRTACPWVLEESNDYMRYPQVLYHASSICQNCIGSNGQQQCEQVSQKVNVFKITGCFNGIAQYQIEETFIPIAFVCTQQRELERSTRIPS